MLRITKERLEEVKIEALRREIKKWKILEKNWKRNKVKNKNNKRIRARFKNIELEIVFREQMLRKTINNRRKTMA